MNKLFDIGNPTNTNYLQGVVGGLVEANASDAAIVTRLQEIYDTSCWLSVISYAEQVIYGYKL